MKVWNDLPDIDRVMTSLGRVVTKLDRFSSTGKAYNHAESSTRV